MTEPPPAPEHTGPPIPGAPGWQSRILQPLIRVVVFVVLTVVLLWLIGSVLGRAIDTVVASAVSLGLAVAASTALMMRIYEMQPFYAVGLFPNRLGAMHLAIGLGWGAGTSLLIVLTQWAAGWVRFERDPMAPQVLPTLAFGLLVLLVGAAGEELLFRGYGFQQLIRALGPWFSILSTSALFGWAHTANPAFSRISLVNTLLFGLVFGYAYWRTQDLWFLVGMHFGWNFLLATIGASVSGLKIELIGVSVVSTGPPLWTGGDYGPEASVLTTAVLVVTAVFLWKAPLGRQLQGLLADREATAHENVAQ